MDQPYVTGFSRYQPDTGSATEKVERPSQRAFDLVWQVLGSNQRRRCRQIYRPRDDREVTRSNSPERVFQGPYRDRMAVDARVTTASAGGVTRDRCASGGSPSGSGRHWLNVVLGDLAPSAGLHSTSSPGLLVRAATSSMVDTPRYLSRGADGTNRLVLSGFEYVNAERALLRDTRRTHPARRNHEPSAVRRSRSEP